MDELPTDFAAGAALRCAFRDLKLHSTKMSRHTTSILYINLQLQLPFRVETRLG